MIGRDEARRWLEREHEAHVAEERGFNGEEAMKADLAAAKARACTLGPTICADCDAGGPDFVVRDGRTICFACIAG